MVTQNVFELPDTLSKKAYQVIISRLDGVRLSEPVYRQRQFDLIEKGIGGFIIFGGHREIVAPFVNEAQQCASVPLFIASDIERGVRQQIEGTTAFPCNMAVAAATDLDDPSSAERLRRAISAVALEARSVGINFPLIPVLDVNLNPDNPIVCTRAFSDQPGVVGRFGSFYLKTLAEAGLLACVKHFPGHGDTSVDSHITLPVISKSKNDLYAQNIAPFRSAIAAGTPAIMIGHLLVPVLDDRPASLSKKIMTDLLRQELGFEGLILTDALTMDALHEYGNASVEALGAGADILLHPDDADRTVSAVLQAIRDGRIKESALQTACERIYDYKLRLLRPVEQEAFYFADHEALARELAACAVTAVKMPSSAIALPVREHVQLMLAGERSLFTPGCWAALSAALCENSSAETLRQAVTVIAIFTSVAAWKGSSGIPPAERDEIQKIIASSTKSIIVSFGSPYVLRYFGNATALIAAYDASPSAQEAVVGCLSGQAAFRGKMPVALNE